MVSGRRRPVPLSIGSPLLLSQRLPPFSLSAITQRCSTVALLAVAALLRPRRQPPPACLLPPPHVNPSPYYLSARPRCAAGLLLSRVTYLRLPSLPTSMEVRFEAQSSTPPISKHVESR